MINFILSGHLKRHKYRTLPIGFVNYTRVHFGRFAHAQYCKRLSCDILFADWLEVQIGSGQIRAVLFNVIAANCNSSFTLADVDFS